MNEKSIREAFAEGAPATCATCPLYHANKSDCGKPKCGGPGQGRDFPDYAGPIPREKFVERCLVCGGANVKYLIVGLETKFALCKKHRYVYTHIGQPDPDKIKHPVLVIEIP